MKYPLWYRLGISPQPKLRKTVSHGQRNQIRMKASITAHTSHILFGPPSGVDYLRHCSGTLLLGKTSRVLSTSFLPCDSLTPSLDPAIRSTGTFCKFSFPLALAVLSHAFSPVCVFNVANLDSRINAEKTMDSEP